jgi:ABC-type bacteriocin/lantibiotic exporter with double-glycine peptidase domain
VIAFIVVSQPWLGVLALAVVLPQAGMVVAIQSRINRRVRQRVQLLRDASDRISDSDLKRMEKAVIADFRDIFETRRRIFLLKLSSKFALSAISAVGTVGILFLGGWLVLQGRSDVGTVVASVTGLTRIEGPWRELVSFFRSASTVRVKYAMLVRSIKPRQAAARPDCSRRAPRHRAASIVSGGARRACCGCRPRSRPLTIAQNHERAGQCGRECSGCSSGGQCCSP